MRYIILDGEKVFAYTDSSSQHYRAPITQYRYRTRSTQQVANYGSWSSWGDTAYASSSSRQVETRTMYSYCDRSQIATYHFYRWVDWSEWTTNQIGSTTNREVESAVFYQYCDKVNTTTYLFSRWTAWSDFTEQAIEPSETVQVKTEKEYRYRSK